MNGHWNIIVFFKIEQSEKNLAAQLQVKLTKQAESAAEAVARAKESHLNLLAQRAGIDLEEMDTVIQPIIEACTKDSISSGKSWIFAHSASHEQNQV